MIDMKLEEELIAKHIKHLEALDLQCKEILPEAFYDVIAYHWFENIGKAKTEEYGVTAWQRLGARGIAGQLSGCFYRWTRMIYNGLTVANPPMFNAVVDTFGYSMLLHCVAKAHPIYLGESVLPRVDHETLLDHLWWPMTPKYEAKMAAISLRMAYQMSVGAQDG